jgi:hypothetical protein
MLTGINTHTQPQILATRENKQTNQTSKISSSRAQQQQQQQTQHRYWQRRHA